MKKTSHRHSSRRRTCICAVRAAGSAFEKEYEAVSDYVPTVQASPYTGDKVTVRDFGSLKQAISEFVLRGETTGKIVFDTAYDGDATEDLASACWQIRTQNALCAYCVENMAYELNKIVTYYEATVYITYAESRAAVSDIVSLPYSSGITDVIRAAFADFEERLVCAHQRQLLYGGRHGGACPLGVYILSAEPAEEAERLCESLHRNRHAAPVRDNAGLRCRQ